MAMLKQYDEGRRSRALGMLLVDRKNEFELLEDSIFWSVHESKDRIRDKEGFVMNFCLEVSAAFGTWNGDAALEPNSDMKALTFLRQLAHGKKTMTELCHLLNLSYTLAEEFKVIYRRTE